MNMGFPNWKQAHKQERVCIVLFNLLLLAYIIWLVYFCYFGPFENLADALKEAYPHNSGPDLAAIYSVMFIFGLGAISWAYADIVEAIFYPDTKEDILIKKKLKILRKKYDGQRDEWIRQRKLLRLSLKLKELKAMK